MVNLSMKEQESDKLVELQFTTPHFHRNNKIHMSTDISQIIT